MKNVKRFDPEFSDSGMSERHDGAWVSVEDMESACQTIEILKSALERSDSMNRLLLEQKTVRDASETLAESERALEMVS